MSKAVVVPLALGIFALSVAFFFPSAISTPASDFSASDEFNVDESQEYRDVIRVQLDAVDETNSTANVTVTDLDTFNSSTISGLNESENETVTLDGETVRVSLDRIPDSTTAVLSTSFSRTYAWNPGATAIVDNFSLIFAMLAMILVGGALVGVTDL